MQALGKYLNAKRWLAEAEQWLSLIGRKERTTAGGVGGLHSIEVKAMIHYQPYDGAKNYHECLALNAEMSKIVRRDFDRIAAEAMKSLRAAVIAARDDAAAEYRREFADPLETPPDDGQGGAS